MAAQPVNPSPPQDKKKEDSGLPGVSDGTFGGLNGQNGGFMQFIAMFIKMLTGGFGDFFNGFKGDDDHPLQQTTQKRAVPYRIGSTLRSGWNGVLDLIGQHESGGDYNLAYGGKRVDFTHMTINQVLDWQKQYVANGSVSSAAGKYQIIQGTLAGLKTQMGLSGNEMFDQKMQDNMARRLLQNRGIDDYAAGNMTTAQIIHNISKEWASVADNDGVSFYQGIAGNKASLGNNAMAAVLQAAKNNPAGTLEADTREPISAASALDGEKIKAGANAKAEFDDNRSQPRVAANTDPSGPKITVAANGAVVRTYGEDGPAAPALRPVNRPVIGNPSLSYS